jgi:hypothetical protein
MEALAQHEIDVQNKDLQDLRPETKLAQAEVLGERPVHQRTLELQTYSFGFRALTLCEPFSALLPVQLGDDAVSRWFSMFHGSKASDRSPDALADARRPGRAGNRTSPPAVRVHRPVGHRARKPGSAR